MASKRDARKRIAIITSALGAGGAEQVIAQLASHWSGQGYCVEIVAFDRPDDPVFHDLPEHVVLHRLGVAGAMRRVMALRMVLARQRPELVISFLTKINLIAALACLGTNIPLICSERNNPERQGAHPLWNLALRAAYRRAGVIVCQTDAVRRCFDNSLRDRLVTIPNPVPALERRPAANSRGRICAVGRLTHQKGFDVLLQAFAMIAPRHPDWTLDVWGDGPERDRLAARIEALDLQTRAHLRGLSTHPRSWMSGADIFVLSSRYEGFPNALAEAMAAGLPVAATDCEFGPADMIESGRSGLLVPQEDSAALAEAMDALIADRELCERLGQGAHRAMERFRSERVLAMWDAVLASVTPPRIDCSHVPWPGLT